MSRANFGTNVYMRARVYKSRCVSVHIYIYINTYLCAFIQGGGDVFLLLYATVQCNVRTYAGRSYAV